MSTFKENGPAFGNLLLKSLHQIALDRNHTIASVRQNIAEAIFCNASAIEFWCKGHVPQDKSIVTALANEIKKSNGFRLDSEYNRFLNNGGIEASELHAIECDQISPFIVGNPIQYPCRFYGRERELSRIFGLWKKMPLQNVAILGPKRSGKTSLLSYLSSITTAPSSLIRKGQRQDWLSNPERYCWIYVDFMIVPTPSSFYNHVLKNLQIPYPEADICSGSIFIELLESRIQSPTLILLDELALAVNSPEFDQSFWNGLRNLACVATQQKLAFAVSAEQYPAQIASEKNISSPFFNIFQTIFLGPMEISEAYDLIKSSPIGFNSTDSEWILEHSKCWPALLQIACQNRFYSLENKETDNRWQEETLREFARYSYLFNWEAH